MSTAHPTAADFRCTVNCTPEDKERWRTASKRCASLNEWCNEVLNAAAERELDPIPANAEARP